MKREKMTGCFAGQQAQIDRVYGLGRREQVAQRIAFLPGLLTAEHARTPFPRAGEVDVIFSTWGMPSFDAQAWDAFERLKIVFYAAGSVKGFAGPLLERGVKVISANRANGIPVAEFVLGQILLANKGYFRNAPGCRARGRDPATEGWMYEGVFTGQGNFERCVALLGCGMIARHLIGLLKPFAVEIRVVDPYLSDAEARALGVCKVTMDEAFRDADVVSNHLPNLPTLQKVIGASHFLSMPENAVFINTGRGAQVDEEGMADVLRRRKDLTCLLDVTHPEPPPKGSPLWTLDNIHITSHIAGSVGREVVRMADYMVAELDRWLAGEPLQDEVTLERMAIMA